MSFTKGSLGAAALWYAQHGWSVFPLVPHDKMPLLSKSKGGNGLHDATTDVETVTEWWTKYPDANIGIATGSASGIVVVDVDGPIGESALAQYGKIDATAESHTGKGRHLIFAATDAAIRNSAGKLGAQLDVRGDGGYIVAPPSIHPNGHRYQWVKGREPWKVTPAKLPQNIVDRLAGVVGAIQPVAPGARQTAVDVVLDGVDEGGRNQALTEYVGRLLAKGLRELEVLELARGVNATKFRPPLPAEEVENVVKSIAGTHARNHTRPAMTDEDHQQATPLVSVTEQIFEDMQRKSLEPVDALSTMLPAWNRSCRGYGGGQGFARGWHIVGAGSAGAGKSLLALNLTSAALRHGHRVGWISLEMSREQLLLRLLGIDTGRPLRLLEPGAQFDPQQFTTASYEFVAHMEDAGSELWIAERPQRDIASVGRLARQAVDAGCRLIILDYLQLVHVPGVPRRDEAMVMVSSLIQSIAFQHNVNTLALSQFNRQTTSNSESSPTIFGLAGSSSIENDADQIALIDHTTKQDTATGKILSLILGKNRHGPASTMSVRLDSNTLRMTESMLEPVAAPSRRSRGDYMERDN